MSPETGNVRLDEIDQEATRQKARVHYIEDHRHHPRSFTESSLYTSWN